jgi:hypothetical protein
LNLRLAKWKQRNISKHQLLFDFKKNVEVIEHAFNQIKQQTGISSTEEIVTTFIKAEE